MQTMIGDTVPAAAAPDTEWPYSGFWRRLAATVIDNLILIVPAMFLGMFSFGLGALALVLAYGTFFESSVHRATWGKQACGLQVMDLSGETLSGGAAFGRQVMKFLGNIFPLITWLVIFVPAAFTAKRQGLHDMAVSSVVRREPGKGIPSWLVGVIAGVVPLVAMIGVLAAIAIPAYQDYVTRAKVAQARVQASPLKIAVEEAFAKTGKLPFDQSEIGNVSGGIGNSRYNNGRIEIPVELGSRQGMLFLTPSAGASRLIWSCQAENLRPSNLPQDCR